MLRCCSFRSRYRVAIPFLTAALVGFTRMTKVRHRRQATTGSQFVTAPRFGSGPSDSGLLQTPCHYRLPHLNELICTGQTFTDKNYDLPVARHPGPLSARPRRVGLGIGQQFWIFFSGFSGLSDGSRIAGRDLSGSHRIRRPAPVLCFGRHGPIPHSSARCFGPQASAEKPSPSYPRMTA
jgi:hypothetical protein